MKGTVLVAVVNRNYILPPFGKIHVPESWIYAQPMISELRAVTLVPGLEPCHLGDIPRGFVMWCLSISFHDCGKISSSGCFQ